jgi:hypothetical protein
LIEQLENLVRAGEHRAEPPVRGEIEGLLESGRARLADAARTDLSLQSRFDLAYNAAHALALAALRAHGCRPRKRYLVFQLLQHTLKSPAPTWRLLAKCHERRNLAEYEGIVEVDQRLLDDLIAATQRVLEAVLALVSKEGIFEEEA